MILACIKSTKQTINHLALMIFRVKYKYQINLPVSDMRKSSRSAKFTECEISFERCSENFHLCLSYLIYRFLCSIFSLTLVAHSNRSPKADKRWLHFVRGFFCWVAIMSSNHCGFELTPITSWTLVFRSSSELINVDHLGDFLLFFGDRLVACGSTTFIVLIKIVFKDNQVFVFLTSPYSTNQPTSLPANHPLTHPLFLKIINFSCSF